MSRRARPRLVPPRAQPAARPPVFDLAAMDRAVRAWLDPLAARFEGGARRRIDRRFAAFAAAWRGPFWAWALLMAFTGLGPAAPALAALFGLFAAGAALVADMTVFRLFALNRIRDREGAMIAPAARWGVAAAVGLHGVIAGAILLVILAPLTIGVLGGYTW